MFPNNDQERKQIPLATGLIDYFPDALIEVAKHSWEGNEQHNPGQPLHWAREKSKDHRNCAMRHFFEAGPEGHSEERIRALRAAAWRILAELQLTIEANRNESSSLRG